MHVARFVLIGALAAMSACDSDVFMEAAGPKRFHENWSQVSVDCPSPERHLVRDQAAWEALWTRTHPDDEPVPEVDFRTDSVLAVCAPVVDSSYFVVTAFEPDEHEVTVYDTHVLPGIGCASWVAPGAFHAIRIDGAVDSVRFVSADAHGAACDPPEAGGPFGWKWLVGVSDVACSEPTGIVIGTQEDWNTFWSTVSAGPQPVVDFATESVIAACLPPPGTYGAFNWIETVSEPDETGRATVGVRQYDYRGCLVITEPFPGYYIVRVNRVLTGATFRYLPLKRCASP